MKRYRPIDQYMIQALEEPNEKRDYVFYKDVVNIVDLLLNECGQDEITAEDFIEEN